MRAPSVGARNRPLGGSARRVPDQFQFRDMGDVAGMITNIEAIGHAKRRHKLQPVLERGLQFHAREMHAEAVVNTETQ